MRLLKFLTLFRCFRCDFECSQEAERCESWQRFDFANRQIILWLWLMLEVSLETKGNEWNGCKQVQGVDRKHRCAWTRAGEEVWRWFKNVSIQWSQWSYNSAAKIFQLLPGHTVASSRRGSLFWINGECWELRCLKFVCLEGSELRGDEWFRLSWLLKCNNPPQLDDVIRNFPPGTWPPGFCICKWRICCRIVNHFELFGDCFNHLGSIQRSRCMVRTSGAFDSLPCSLEAFGSIQMRTAWTTGTMARWS